MKSSYYVQDICTGEEGSRIQKTYGPEKSKEIMLIRIAGGSRKIQRDIWDNRGNLKRILDIFWVVDERQVFVCKLIGKKELFYKGDENYLLIYVYHDQTYNLDNGTQVDTLLSNDSGVAFIVKTKEGNHLSCRWFKRLVLGWWVESW